MCCGLFASPPIKSTVRKKQKKEAIFLAVVGFGNSYEDLIVDSAERFRRKFPSETFLLKLSLKRFLVKVEPKIFNLCNSLWEVLETFVTKVKI